MDDSTTAKLRTKIFSIPFTGQSSNIIKRILEQINDDILVNFRNINTFGNNLFSKIKDATPFDKRTNLFDSIPCSGCDHVYIGGTLQYDLSARRVLWESRRNNDYRKE